VSYSRWSNSVWYTYADVNGGFTVCGERNFSNEELKDIPKCLEHFKKDYSAAELEELAGYVKRYLSEYSDEAVAKNGEPFSDKWLKRCP